VRFARDQQREADRLLAELKHVGRPQRGLGTARRRSLRLCRRRQGRPRRREGPAARATVYRSAQLPDGRVVVSHTKFIVVDHELVLLTSANFSYSAENRNIEFGLLIHDSGLAASIESTMVNKHGTLYELA
jgi:phosphatidylserine/phosphatidylglycerophosphate/cardiolipin synthase-like enzyme